MGVTSSPAGPGDPPTGDRSGRPRAPLVAATAWAWYGVVSLALVGLGAILPRDGLWVAVHLLVYALGIGAILAGIRLHRPADARPWAILAVGLGLFEAGNAFWYPTAAGLAQSLPFPSVADVLYLAGYTAIIAAIAIVGRASGVQVRLRDTLDAVIIGVGVGVLQVQLIFDPHLASGMNTTAVVVAAGYPIVDVAILAAALRLVLAGLRPGLSVLLLGASIVLQLIADTIYGLGVADGSFDLQSPALILLPLGVVALGAAALHPSMVELTAGRAGRPIGDRVRLPVLIAPVLASPAVLALHTQIGQTELVIMAILQAALIVLVFGRIVTLMVDVEAYRSVQSDLAETEARYRNLVERVPAMTFANRIDPERRTAQGAYLSPQVEQILGYRPEEFEADESLWLSIVHPLDRERVEGLEAARLRAVLEEGPAADGPFSDEYRMVTRDGRVVWVREDSRAVRDEQGTPAWMQGVLLDITPQKDAEERIRALNAELEDRIAARTAELAMNRTVIEDLMALNPALVFAGTVDGEQSAITFVSPHVEQMLGLRPEDLLGPTERWLELVEPGDLPAFGAATAMGLVGTASTVSYEIRFRHADGTWRWLLTTTHYEPGPDGQPRAFVGNAVDITVRKAAEAELAAAKEEADRASRAKTEFLSRMSHELRTPLNAVMGFGQLLELSALTGDDRDSVEQILESGRSLLAMIDGILEFTRVDAGRLTLSIEPVSLGDLVRESIDLVRPIAAERGIAIVDGLAGRPPRVVLTDRRRLGQALLGLLDNAIRYNRSGGSVTISATDGAPGRLLLEIADTGAGIDPERIARLFEPFEATGPEEIWSRGIGLGLAFAKRLIEAMAGSISVRSTLGEGSAFTLDLPLADAAEAAALTGVAASDAAAPAAPVRTILYIEDNFANIELVERVLQARPTVRLIAATQGRLGMELAREHHPDLVLLDLHLPDVAPDETIRGLRDDPRTAGIPVVILSSEASPARAREMAVLGARAYLTKPLDLAAFLRVVDEVLARGGEPA